ncbi:MFS transporter [Streptomyces sp. NPDC001177]
MTQHTARPTQHTARPAITVLLACLGVFTSYVPIGAVAVSLPAIQQGLNASTSDLQWISDAFILPMAALNLTFGLIGDLHGRKKAYIAGLLLFAAGSVTSLTAHGAHQVWVGQALSGAGAAALLTSTLALISHACPTPHSRAQAISLWAASLGLGVALGPLVSGVILEHASWRWIFLPTALIALIAAVVSTVFLEDSRSAHGRAMDVPGQVTAVLAITALAYAVIEGGNNGWGQRNAVAAFVLAAVTLVAFVTIELRSKSPMLSMKLFASRSFTGAGSVVALALFAQVGMVFALSLFFGTVQQLSALQIAYRFLALNGLTVILGPVAGRIMVKVAPGILLTGGLLITSAGMFGLLSLSPTTGFLAASVPLAAVGAGLAFVMAPITALAVGSVPHHLAGMAAAGSNTLRQVGGAMGPAVFGAILTSRAISALPADLAESGLPSSTQHQVMSAVHIHGLSAADHLGLAPQDTRRALGAFAESFTTALHVCLAIGAIGLLIGAAVTVWLIGLRRTPMAQPPQPAQARETEALSVGS